VLNVAMLVIVAEIVGSAIILAIVNLLRAFASALVAIILTAVEIANTVTFIKEAWFV